MICSKTDMENLIDIQFEYRYDENQPWDEGNICSSLEFYNFDEGISKLRNSQEIVIPMKTIQIIFDYPFGNKFKYTFQVDADTDQGFTRRYLATKIYEIYKDIYDQDTIAEEKGLPLPYGTFGHSLEQLSLVKVRQLEDGKNIFDLVVDS